jgi:hypothetical protein
MLVVSASLANNLTVNVYAGRSNENPVMDCVVCVAEQAESLIRDSGIFKCNVVIQSQERASTGNFTSSLSQTVYDAFGRSDLNAVLASYSTGSIYVYDTTVNSFKTSVVADDKSWIQELNLEVIAGLL